MRHRIILIAMGTCLLACVLLPGVVRAAQPLTPMRFLYPTASGTFAVPWIAKEAGYFAAEGLDIELIRVGGSARMVAAMLGGSAPIIHAGASASMAAAAAGSDSVVIGCLTRVSPFHFMARPEIKQVADLKGKRIAINGFGSTSDFLVRLALRKFSLEVGKDVTLIAAGGETEAFGSLQAGSVQAAALSFPSYVYALRADMKELVKFSELGFEAVNAALVSTRSYLTQNRETATKFVRAFVRGMHRYGTDKEFSKKVIGKYTRSSDDQALEATWKDITPNLLRVPRPSLKAIQFIIDEQFKDKNPQPKPESFVDTTILDQLEKSGFIDAVYK